MAETTDTVPMWDRAALPLPEANTLSDQQQRGADCAWCRTALTAETAIDLGERVSPDSGTTAFPRGCRPCTREHAYRAILDHAPYCAQCVVDASGCATVIELRRLTREARR